MKELWSLEELSPEVKKLAECKKTIHIASKTKVSVYFVVEAIEV